SRRKANHWLLSYFRAKAVADQLVQNGISRDKFTIEPKAYLEPFTTSKEKIGRRIVQIVVSTEAF
ncbi:MAG: hypothetical protein HY606_10025, partial [Planctomycetes bacterium]|nr:hypothetical protein [Planctomycetota bacterium]